MEPSSFALFIQEYKTVLGGLSIALATIIAVYFNYIASRKAEHRLKSENKLTDACLLGSNPTYQVQQVSHLL